MFCSQYDIDLVVVDMGVNATFDDHPLLMQEKVAYGTENFTITDAMTKDEALRAIQNGAECFYEKQRRIALQTTAQRPQRPR